ncbi:MAG TPA: hypothetical protein VHW65_11480 [Gemmatimonadales bacterium]|jgi:hypothetical protein|nr:hypothetical protein [Gemmatimonadales bacterium]
MPDSSQSIPRRRFLGGVALTGAVLALPVGVVSAAAVPAVAAGAWDDHWLKQLKARHRVIFDCQTLSGDLVGYPGRYLDAMLDGYGAKPGDVQIVIGLSGKAWPAALDDQRWQKYSAAGRFAGNGSRPVDAAAIAAFQKRGATFLVCDDALLQASQDLAAAGGAGEAATIHTDLRAGLLPAIVAVPAMSAAIALAQQHHCAYIAA